jgi:hypothetical protein
MRIVVPLLFSLLTSFSVQGQDVTITPSAPTPADVIFVQVYLQEYLVRTQSHSVSGNTVTVTIVNDLPSFLPSPPGVATEPVGPLPSGTYTFVVVGAGPIAPMTVIVAPSNNVADAIVIRPAQPTALTPVQIDVPVEVCAFGSDPVGAVTAAMRLASTSVNIAYPVVSIAVALPHFVCFDSSPVVRALTFPLPLLPPGDYTVNYARSVDGVLDHEESAALSVSADSNGPVPVEGMWWDPTQSGSGYAIAVKHDVLVMTVFSYTGSGLPQWYLLIGPYMNNSTTGNLLKFTDGQCIFCTMWQLPLAAGDDGVATVTFSSPTTGTILLPGGRITQIVPQDF